MNVDRSVVSWAVRKVGNNPDLIKSTGSILEKIGLADPAVNQQ